MPRTSPAEKVMVTIFLEVTFPSQAKVQFWPVQQRLSILSDSRWFLPENNSDNNKNNDNKCFDKKKYNRTKTACDF